MYVLFKDQEKNEDTETQDKIDTAYDGKNTSSECEDPLPLNYYRKEKRRFKYNINLLDKDKLILRKPASSIYEIKEEAANESQAALEKYKKKKTFEITGNIIAYCIGTDFQLPSFIKDFKTHNINNDLIKIKKVFSEVLFCSAFEEKKTFFLFRFGCIVLWDFNVKEKEILFSKLKNYLNEAYPDNDHEIDSMYYFNNILNESTQYKNKLSHERLIKVKNDIIHINSKDIFEKLSYSYAFAQCVKLSYFEKVVDDTIDKTKHIPEFLAKNGKIQLKKNDISKKIGELFVNRFYINMNTDILDTPEIFWDYDEFTNIYEYFRKYLDISKRVEILNHRLDIIKDLYDMLQNELTIQHGNKLEWIVIYLICVEVIIDIVWTIIIKGVFKWV